MKKAIRRSNETNATNNMEDKTMKRNSKSNNVASNATNNMEDKTMKKAIRRSNETNATNNMEDKAMKKAIRKSNNVASNNETNNPALQAAQILAALDPAILRAIGLSQASEGKASEEGEQKSPKADRTYEIPSIGADFVKSGIYAKPKSEDAGRYVAKAKALCEDVISNLSAPIAKEIATIAEKAEGNGGDTLKNDLLQLAEKWEIPAPSMRVIMQLCAPVVGVCNPETNEIARRVYGMARANSLMGSACNTLMYAKASDKEKALPFKRVAHNLTSLGLDFSECFFVGQCDFVNDDAGFGELVKLCDMWLAKCILKGTPEPKSSPRQKASPEKSEDKSAQLLAALQALLNK